jgi:sulfide:quinone oxidoreductase
MPTNVLIAGGGPAALEAALVLHRLAADHVAVTLLAPESEFTYRPRSVLSPFAAGGATRYPLARIAADAGFAHRRGRLARVDPDAHRVETGDGEQIDYDVLLVAAGAHTVPEPAGVLAFSGSPADAERLHGLIQDVEGGYTHRVAFVVPPAGSWPLPLYELALMLAERAFETGVEVRLHFVTPETAPLDMFGEPASREVAELLAGAGITLHTGSRAGDAGSGRLRLEPGGDTIEAQRVVTLPRLQGPALPGLPADAGGFLVTDRHGRVQGVTDVYAAGDITAHPVKQGGLACQQADAAAEHIAAFAGADVDPVPFTPVLRGILATEHWVRFLRGGDDAAVAERALWWPPAKIAGRELATYLEGLDAGTSHGPLRVPRSLSA